jgi:CTP synthase (UTP-ammonia lyase)
MSASHRVAVVGDFNPRNHTHIATNESLAHVGLVPVWVPTDAVDADPAMQLAPFPGIWSAPPPPSRHRPGALRAVRHARVRGVPLVGT